MNTVKYYTLTIHIHIYIYINSNLIFLMLNVYIRYINNNNIKNQTQLFTIKTYYTTTFYVFIHFIAINTYLHPPFYYSLNIILNFLNNIIFNFLHPFLSLFLPFPIPTTIIHLNTPRYNHILNNQPKYN